MLFLPGCCVSLFISPLNRRGRGIPDTIILPLGIFAKGLCLCTPGILMLFTDYLSRHPHPFRERNPRPVERASVPLHRLYRHRRRYQASRGREVNCY
jgi:hypothetical protein